MRHPLVLFAFAALTLNAWSASLEAPKTIYLYGEAKEIPIKIVNEGETPQSFAIQFSAPTQFELSAAEGTIAAKKSKTITLTIYPRKDLTGQTYETKLTVSFGEKKTVKKINIVFRGQKETNKGNQKEQETPPVGLFALISSIEEIQLTQELALNLVLGIIATVLLIAFIARLVKRMEGK